MVCVAHAVVINLLSFLCWLMVRVRYWSQHHNVFAYVAMDVGSTALSI
jgi:hypothetical protein